MRGHVLAMGGGGFLMPEAGEALDRYALELTGVSTPRVCWLGTAGGDSEAYAAKFCSAFRLPLAHASVLSLFRRDDTDLRDRILSQHVVYVGGGNTANLLAIWRAHGLDVILREAWSSGAVLCGVSAGALCWFEEGVTDSFGPLAALKGCLGFLRGSFCPHYDGEPQRRPTFTRLVASGALAPGLAADDGAAAHFIGGKLNTVISARPGATVVRVNRSRSGEVIEERLEAYLLK
jgi:dipeptidase E